MLSMLKSYLVRRLITGSAAFGLLVGTSPGARADWRVGRPVGGPVNATAVTLSPVGELTLADGTKLPAAAWHGLRRTAVPLAESPVSVSVVRFANGDRITGRLLDSDGTTARVRPAFANVPDATVTVPLSSVAAYLARVPADEEMADFRAKSRSRDVIVNRRGDRFLGSVAAVDDAGFRLQDGAKTTVVERASVAAVWFSTDLARVRKPKGRYYRVCLVDGTRWAVAGVSLDATTATLSTFGKETITAAINDVIAVDVEQGPAVSLSDLKPAEEAYQPFDHETRMGQFDRNSLGRPLRLSEFGGVSVYGRGVGLSGGLTLTYDMAGKYKLFEATAGLDARYGNRGDVTLRILKDGQSVMLPDSGRVGSVPREIGIDVSNCKTLTISVERGRRPGVEEVVNLVNAKLIP